MIVITGATGFIGQYLCEELTHQGASVIACARSMHGKTYFADRGISYRIVDVCRREDFERLPKTGVDAVIHLAALVPKPPRIESGIDYVAANTFGTLNVLEYCRTCNIRKIIYITSHYEACNIRPLPIKEEYPIVFNYNDDHTVYIISKIAARSYVQHYSEAYGMQGIILRMTGVRGHNKWAALHDSKGFNQGFWEIFIDKARKSQPIELWGDNKNVRDHLYIKDAISGIISALKSTKANGLYNLATGAPVTLEEEVISIVKVFSPPDNPSQILHKPDKPGLHFNFVYDIAKAKNDFGYAPKYTYLTMLEDHKKVLENLGL
jgi:UDP-glucose 4-epimerase